MGIGTSLGAYFDDSFHQSAAQWDPKYDENEYSGEGVTHDDTPISVKKPVVMPFPDNKNPDSDFSSRFGNLPPSGIMNDLKPQPDKPIARKINEVLSPTDPRDNTGSYNTPIGGDLSEEIGKYHKWLKDNKLHDEDRYNYDLQGAYKAGLTPDERGHLPDTYKKPSHPTFSDESIYHGKSSLPGEPPNEGGHWEKLDEEGKKWSFTPGQTNYDHHSTEDMREYFKKYEPDSTLILPQSGLESLIHRVSDIKLFSPLMDIENDKNVSSFGGASKNLPEAIKSAALRHGEEIFEAPNHGMALGKIMDKYPTSLNWTAIRDGFTTTKGRFISREEAMDIAKAQDQLHPSVKEAIKKLQSQGNDSTMLLSEDLN